MAFASQSAPRMGLPEEQKSRTTSCPVHSNARKRWHVRKHRPQRPMTALSLVRYLTRVTTTCQHPASLFYHRPHKPTRLCPVFLIRSDTCYKQRHTGQWFFTSLILYSHLLDVSTPTGEFHWSVLQVLISPLPCTIHTILQPVGLLHQARTHIATVP